MGTPPHNNQAKQQFVLNVPYLDPTCSAWLQADRGITLVSGAVDSWADVSTGKGFTVTATGASYRASVITADPNYGSRNSVDFLGTARLTAATMGAWTQPATYYILARIKSLSDAQNAIMDGSPHPTGRQLVARYTSYGTGILLFAGSGVAVSSTACTTSATIHSATFNGSSSSYRKGLGAVEPLSLGGSGTGATLSIGWSSVDTTHFNGTICIWSRFSGPRDLARDQRVVNWMKNYAGI
jgi:hypothetical protein